VTVEKSATGKTSATVECSAHQVGKPFCDIGNGMRIQRFITNITERFPKE